jgi:predicted ArsR family transcriptional regulator
MGPLLDPGLSDALLFANSREQPVTADDLAASRGIHRNVARGRLERLVGAGLLIPEFERRSGRSGPGAGRPAKAYRVAPDVPPLELPPRRYETLLGLLVDSLPARRLGQVGAEFGRSLARGFRKRSTLGGALANACAALRRAGFHAIVVEADEEEGLVATASCPLRPVVRANGRGRELDHGLWEGLVERLLGTEAAVVAETAGCHDDGKPCFVRIHTVNTDQRS